MLVVTYNDCWLSGFKQEIIPVVRINDWSVLDAINLNQVFCIFVIGLLYMLTEMCETNISILHHVTNILR
jgi:hypothetical protein